MYSISLYLRVVLSRVLKMSVWYTRSTSGRAVRQSQQSLRRFIDMSSYLFYATHCEFFIGIFFSPRNLNPSKQISEVLGETHTLTHITPIFQCKIVFI